MPKIREREIESFSRKSSDALNNKKDARICISLLKEELDKIKALSMKDGRSVSAYIRLKLLNILEESDSK